MKQSPYKPTKRPPQNQPVQPNGAQADMVARARAESCIDPTVTLCCNGVSPTGRPEFGPTVAEYFAKKHGPNGPGPGRFFPLHALATFRPEFRQ